MRRWCYALATVALFIGCARLASLPSTDAHQTVSDAAPECCTVWADACACWDLTVSAASSNWLVESSGDDWFSRASPEDADWHLQRQAFHDEAGIFETDTAREVVRTNHAMTELWVHVDHAKVHLVREDGGEALCR